ncbi:MAG: adenosylcobinamide-GDP ribazoletransferase [Lachnospirales bacterium]
MNVVKSLIIAFSMFSKIPMPNVKWEEENMKYMFVFFPFIGLIVGGVNCLWFYLCQRAGLNSMVFASVSALIPILITGGIHIDGFMDLCDALSSHKDREKMLEILSDSHIGAFSVICVIIYYVLFFAMMTQINNMWQIYMIAFSYFIVRAISVLIIITADTAKNSGLIYTFKNSMNKVITGVFNGFFVIMTVGILESYSILVGIILVFVLLLFSVYFVFFIIKKFGGITGDLIGYFISLGELLSVIVIAIGGIL